MPTLDFISIDPWRMIMQIGNLIILFLLMKKFLFKPVKAILDKRQAEVDSMYNEAAAAETAAKEIMSSGWLLPNRRRAKFSATLPRKRSCAVRRCWTKHASRLLR